MAENQPSPERIALNRVTFGAREQDVALVRQQGWAAWVEGQLAPPAGDDPDLDRYLRAQIMHIQYDAYDDNQLNWHWKAVNEDRPLRYLTMSAEDIWKSARATPSTVAFAETTRLETELVSGIYIRNAHSRYQLREFMADFWLNHFSVSKAKGIVLNTLINYDRDVVRPNVFGNFRQLLEAVASSQSMLWYLDNASSTATLPNENYARELMELHTMGRDAYFGKNPGGGDVSAKGFTDADIVEASKALSGWTLQYGQTGGVDDGKFVFSPLQHNTTAGRFLGFDLATLDRTGIAQGRKVLDLVAAHAATAPFVCGKLCRRIFGDTPPPAVVDRAVAAWTANRDRPDQIARVLRAILLDGPEIAASPQTKVRRPYERFIAMVRATDTVLGPAFWQNLFWDLNDSPFIWPTPDGRPDTNAFWLSTYVHVNTWDYMKRLGDGATAGIATSFFSQTPVDALKSASRLVDYWVNRMLGYPLNDDATAALIAMADALGPPANTENWERPFARDVIATIAAAPQFVLR
jgi:uncharacterized protein (DUF1800 family)